MKNIGDFLSKFKIIRNPKQNREVITHIIKEVTSIELDDSCVQIKNKIVFIHAHPAIKSAIFIKKDKIISLIKEKLPDIQVVNLG